MLSIHVNLTFFVPSKQKFKYLHVAMLRKDEKKMCPPHMFFAQDQLGSKSDNAVWIVFSLILCILFSVSKGGRRLDKRGGWGWSRWRAGHNVIHFALRKAHVICIRTQARWLLLSDYRSRLCLGVLVKLAFWSLILASLLRCWNGQYMIPKAWTSGLCLHPMYMELTRAAKKWKESVCKS